jgi:hypothetical protein
VVLLAFENTTSAPLIIPVVTITPLPLLYHVRTFYIARYTSFTTHPNQTTYTFYKLQKKKKKRQQRKGYRKREKYNNDNDNNIFLNPVPTYTYTTSKQHSCVQGQALPGFLTTAQHLCAFLI